MSRIHRLFQVAFVVAAIGIGAVIVAEFHGPTPAVAMQAATPESTSAAAPTITTQATVTATVSATTAPTAAATGAPTTGASSGPITKLVDLFPSGPGKELVLDNCGTCHSPACPVFGQRTADHWQSVKQNHRNRVSGMSDADYNTLFDYLEQNFNDKTPEPNASPALKANSSCTAGF